VTDQAIITLTPQLGVRVAWDTLGADEYRTRRAMAIPCVVLGASHLGQTELDSGNRIQRALHLSIT